MPSHSVDAFLDGHVPAELAALVRIEPFRRPNGVTDTGWSCREHAVLSAALLVAAGHSADVIHGANIFVQGPSGDLPPVGIGNDENYLERGHSWSYIDGYGMLDLSPRLDERYSIDPRWRPIPARFGVTGDRWDVGGQGGAVLLCSSEIQFRQATAAATHAPQGKAAAVYWEQDREPFALGMLEDVTYIDSPLTGRVKGFLGDDGYLRIAAHLWGVMNGDREPMLELATRKQAKAWNKLRSLEPGEIASFRNQLVSSVETRIEGKSTARA